MFDWQPSVGLKVGFPSHVCDTLQSIQKDTHCYVSHRLQMVGKI